jgi:hypothetical protein
MIFEIFAGTVLLINAAILIFTLSAVGHLHLKVDYVAQSQAQLTVDVAKRVLDTLNARMDDDEYKYQYLAECGSRTVFALTHDPDFKPLNDINEFATGLFSVCDDLGIPPSRWDDRSTEDEAEALVKSMQEQP